VSDKKVLGSSVLPVMHISVCLMELSFLELTLEAAETKLFMSLVVVVRKEKTVILWESKNFFMFGCINHCCMF